MQVYTVTYWEGTVLQETSVYTDPKVAVRKAAGWVESNPKDLGAVVQAHTLDSDRGGQVVWRHTVYTTEDESSYWRGKVRRYHTKP